MGCLRDPLSNATNLYHEPLTRFLSMKLARCAATGKKSEFTKKKFTSLGGVYENTHLSGRSD